MTADLDRPRVGEFLIDIQNGQYAVSRWSLTGKEIYGKDTSPWFPFPERYEPGWTRIALFPTLEEAEKALRCPRRYDAAGVLL